LHKPNDDLKLVFMNLRPEIARSWKNGGEEEYYLIPASTLLNRMAIRTYLKMILFLHYANCIGSFDLLDRERKNFGALQSLFDLW